MRGHTVAVLFILLGYSVGLIIGFILADISWKERLKNEHVAKWEVNDKGVTKFVIIRETPS